jgi:hypothetical protein
VQAGLDNATRATALFLTNKENMVAATGHFEGTALNSDRQLWSVAGSLAMTYRVLFGMRFAPDRLVFRPMVPPSYAGERTLRGVRYRGATLTVTVRGAGTGVARATLDGEPLERAEVPATLTGEHVVEIELDGRWPRTTLNLVANRVAPATPRAELSRSALRWEPVPGAVRYVVHRDGAPVDTVSVTSAPVQSVDALTEYQVAAIDSAGLASFLSEPVRIVPPSAEQTVKPTGALERTRRGYTGGGYLRLERGRNTTVRLPLRVTRAGVYAVDARYANGNGPVNTEDKVAVRTLLVDGDTVGVLVMPQRGVNAWDEWGWTNAVRVPLTAGAHTLTIVYTPLDENMNRRVNTALLDHVRVTRIAPEPSRTR